MKISLGLLVIACVALSAHCSRIRRQAPDQDIDLEDRWGWRNPQDGNWNDRPGRPSRPTRPTRPTANTFTSVPPASSTDRNLASCLAGCITTQEYNPVCGTNRITYDNMAKLECGQYCGQNVQVARLGTCLPV